MHVMRADGTGLNTLIDILPQDVYMAEVGSYSGESARMFLRKAKILHCIDLWLPYEDYGVPIGYMDQAEAAFDILQCQYSDRIIKHKMDSLKAADLFEDRSFDVVYIDADHSYPAARSDILKWRQKVKPNGILAGHDYDHHHIGVKLAVDELLGTPDRCFEDSSWMKIIP